MHSGHRRYMRNADVNVFTVGGRTGGDAMTEPCCALDLSGPHQVITTHLAVVRYAPRACMRIR